MKITDKHIEAAKEAMQAHFVSSEHIGYALEDFGKEVADHYIKIIENQNENISLLKHQHKEATTFLVQLTEELRHRDAYIQSTILTKREQIALSVLNGMISSGYREGINEAVKISFESADALLEYTKVKEYNK